MCRITVRTDEEEFEEESILATNDATSLFADLMGNNDQMVEQAAARDKEDAAVTVIKQLAVRCHHQWCSLPCNGRTAALGHSHTGGGVAYNRWCWMAILPCKGWC
jgi:hypothetical protein